jgi:hypothetical protein
MTERTFLGFVTEAGVFRLDQPIAFRAFAKRFAGYEVEVEIRKKRDKRSDRQNAAFWAALTPWAHDLGYEPNELKDELLALLWGYDDVPSPLTGEIRRIPTKPRSSRLSTQEFCELMEFAAVKAAETGYVMQMPDEYKAAKAKAEAAKQAAKHADAGLRRAG